ncbi:MAG: ABC transporter permease [Tenuifilaceae bacterium]
MKTILFIIQKEFLQVFRNKTMLPIIFMVPIVQLLVLAFAANFEIKNINLAIVDFDHSTRSRDIISRFEASPFYTLIPTEQSVEKATELVHANKADAVLVLQHGFESDLDNAKTPKVQLLINAIDGMAASLTNAYTSSILMNFSKKIMMEKVGITYTQPPTISSTTSYWYNPELKYSHFMVPGILVILVTIIGMFLTALNIVREIELGTIEQINVTPIKRYQFIIGKLIPFWIIALFELGFGLTIGKIIFDIPFNGSLLLLFSFAGVYLIVALGAGLIISTISKSQQQVMFVAFFFMIIFVLMSGIFTPTDSMPLWAKTFNLINPLYYFMKVIRMILLKGAEFADISRYFYAVTVLAITVITVAIFRYRKTT